MYLIKDVLRMVISEIDDSQTWINMSTVSRLTYRLCTELLKTVERIDSFNCVCRRQKLPSGKRHGRETGGNARSRVVRHWFNNELHGPYEHKYWGRGVDLMKGHYYHNKEHKIWYYYSNGELTGIERYHDGTKHGMWETYTDGTCVEQKFYWHGMDFDHTQQWFQDKKEEFRQQNLISD